MHKSFLPTAFSFQDFNNDAITWIINFNDRNMPFFSLFLFRCAVRDVCAKHILISVIAMFITQFFFFSLKEHFRNVFRVNEILLDSYFYILNFTVKNKFTGQIYPLFGIIESEIIEIGNLEIEITESEIIKNWNTEIGIIESWIIERIVTESEIIESRVIESVIIEIETIGNGIIESEIIEIRVNQSVIIEIETFVNGIIESWIIESKIIEIIIIGSGII